MIKQRTITALVLAPLAVAVVLLLPTIALAMLTAAMVLVALWEWTRLSGCGARPIRSAIVAAAALVFVALWMLRAEPIAWWLIGVGVAWWLVAALWLRHFSFAAAPTRGNAAIKLLGGLLAIFPAWVALIKLHGAPPKGPFWALLALALVWAADSAAYLAGSRYGRAKLCPQISPNKTIAGAWGALGGGAIVAVVGGWLLGLRGVPLAAIIALSLVSVVASIVGDLFESLIKRQASVKDSGRFFPGHGGIFDRFDSVFAALPVFVAGKALIDLLLGP